MKFVKYLLGISLLISAISGFGQSPCNTTISFQGLPTQAICSSVHSDDRILAYPAGGTWQGQIIYSTGHLNAFAKPTGSYWAVYTAPDSCATQDSVLISVLNTKSELTVENQFDCQNNNGANLIAIQMDREFLAIMQGDESEYLDRANPYLDKLLASARDIEILINTDISECVSRLTVPTTNAPRIDALVDYVCSENRAYLDYTGPRGTSNQTWRRYNTVPDDLASVYYFGDRLACTETGNYKLSVTYDNGCRSSDVVKVDVAYPIVPGVNAGSYAPLSCAASVHDTCELLGNSLQPFESYSWSMPDGSVFPGDSTIQRPLVPTEPATYYLRTVNTVSGCFSKLDSAVLVRRSPDTTQLSALVCEGSSYEFGSQLYYNEGQFEIGFTNRFGCDSTILLDLSISPSPIPSYTVDGPDATGRYTVSTAVTDGVAPFEYAWSNGTTTSQLVDVLAGEYSLMVTDAYGCVSNINVTVGVSSLKTLAPNAVRVFPNPVGDVLRWEFSDNSKAARVTLRDLNGRQIKQSQDLNTIEVSDLAAGIYILEILSSDGEIWTGRVVKGV